MRPISHIAIDGNSASGKTTVARIVARRLRRPFLDTGLMYRAVTALAIEQCGSDIAEEPEIAERIASELDLVYVDEGLEFDILWRGKEIEPGTHSSKVDASVSVVSAMRGVREILVRTQQASAGQRSVIMAGRDIGEKVLPHAALKVFLTASAEARAKRRSLQTEDNMETILQSLKKRDALDTSREISPMRPAPDAVTIDTEHLSAEQVADRVLSLFEKNRSKKGVEAQ